MIQGLFGLGYAGFAQHFLYTRLWPFILQVRHIGLRSVRSASAVLGSLGLGFKRKLLRKGVCFPHVDTLEERPGRHCDEYMGREKPRAHDEDYEGLLVRRTTAQKPRGWSKGPLKTHISKCYNS